MIYIGSDHGGFDLKEKIKKWLNRWGYAYDDMGNALYDKEDDYPFFAQRVAEKVTDEEKNGQKYPFPWQDRPKGILICRSSAGMVIAANKVKGAKAISATSVKATEMARLHNDINILALGADYLEESDVKKILNAFLSVEFSGEERHVRRVKMISDYENK